jgi:hypothetical protein
MRAMASIIRPDIEVLDNGAPIFYCPYWPTATPCGHARRSMHAAADALNEMQLAGMPLREVLRN